MEMPDLPRFVDGLDSVGPGPEKLKRKNHSMATSGRGVRAWNAELMDVLYVSH